jgi:hypothetical protein
MKKVLIITVLSLGIFIGLSGCSDNSPMGKLKSDVAHPETESFWLNENKKNSDLWKEAVSYCKQHKEKPNCSNVLYFNMFDHLKTTVN